MSIEHRCHVPGCNAATPPRWLTCRPCWRHVPKDLQMAVYSTVRARGEHVDASWAPWWRAQGRAIAAVLRARGDKIAAEKYLARELVFAERLDGKGRTEPAGPAL